MSATSDSTTIETTESATEALGNNAKFLVPRRPVRYGEVLILIGILMVAAYLRFTGLDWGKNLYLHPDERFQTMVATRTEWPESIGAYFDSAASPLNPYNREFGSYIYGTFPIFVSKLIGTITDREVYGNAHMPGRALSAFCDLVTVLLVYLIGRRLFDYRVGLLAAALSAVTVLQIQSAHYFTSDSALIVFCLAAFYFAVRADGDGRAWWHLAAGIAVALAASSKINGFAIAPVLLLPIFERWRKCGFRSIWRSGPRDRMAPLLGFAVSLIAAIWVFRVAQPYAFSGPSLFSFRLDSRWVNDIQYWRDVQSGVGDSPPSIQWADRTPVLFTLQNLVLWGMGPLLGITAVVSLILACLRLLTARRLPAGWQLILVGWPLFHLIYYGSGFVQTMRYLLPAYPFLAVLAAALLIRVWEIGGERQWGGFRLGRSQAIPFGAVPAIVVLSASLLYAIGFAGIYTRTTTREAASRWMYANVPAGSVIASEHWDDGIPVSLPGFDPRQYTGFQLELFFTDSEAKLDTLITQLAEADYIVVTSNRLYGTIPRMPERYPMTSEYYRMLFSGDLGFDLAHVETSYPTYLGFELNDDDAEEAFTVYDHPKVFVFRKGGAFDAAAIRTRLEPTLDAGAYAIWPAYAGNDLLLMDDGTRAAQQASGTWRQMFDPGGLTNRIPTLVWYLALQIMALAAVPLCWRLLPSLPDRGYAVAKTVGVLGASYVAWMLASIQAISFGPDAVGLGIVLIGLISVWLLRDRYRDLILDLRVRWQAMAMTEGLFLVCFLGGVWMRAQNPDLWHRYRGGEKPMDFAYFNAILRSTSFPAFDPWFAGGHLNYYYFGFVQWASVTRLTGIVPEVAYNLAVPTVFALVCVNVWSVANALIAALRKTSSAAPTWRSLAPGLLAPLFVAVLGNLDLVQRIGRGEYGYTEGVISRTLPVLGGIADIISGLLNAILHHPDLPPDIYWAATRIVPGTINEFPAFSFLFADLHAHVMAMPLASAALILASQIALGLRGEDRHHSHDVEDVRLMANTRLSGRWASTWDLCRRPAVEATTAGFITSALYATNTWDFPTYLALLIGAFAIRECVAAQWRITWPLLARIGTWAVSVIVLGRILFWPFYASFVAESGVTRQPERTSLSSFLTIHGLFLVAIAGFLLVELLTYTSDRGYRLPIPRFTFTNSTTGIVDDRRPTLASVTIERRALPLGSALAFISGLVIAFGLLAGGLSLMLLGAIGVTAAVAWLRRDDPARLVLLLMLAAALGLGLVVEQVALKGDIGRMNTVFKLYLQTWMLFGVVSAVTVVAVWSNARIRRNAAIRSWSAVLVVLLAGAAVYPAISTPARVGDRFTSIPPTLDGMAYMETAVYDDAPEDRQPVSFPLSNDLAAIDWLRTNIDGSPVVLEATIPGYRWGSRVSVYTGLPTVLGWDWHQVQQRPGFGMMIEERRSDVKEIFGAVVPFGGIRHLLDKYHVQLIYIGDLERAYYDEAGLSKFDGAVESGELKIVYQRSGVTIYRYDDELTREG